MEIILRTVVSPKDASSLLLKCCVFRFILSDDGKTFNTYHRSFAYCNIIKELHGTINRVTDRACGMHWGGMCIGFWRGKLDGKTTLGRLRHGWEYIKMNLQDVLNTALDYTAFGHAVKGKVSWIA